MKAANKNTIPITSESDILCAFRNLTSSYEFLYIHKLMYQFLCLRTPCFLQFPPYTDLASEYDRTAIKWNVPAPITPFLICYIKAASKFKKMPLSLRFP